MKTTAQAIAYLCFDCMCDLSSAYCNAETHEDKMKYFHRFMDYCKFVEEADLWKEIYTLFDKEE